MAGYNLAMRNAILDAIAANIGGGTNTVEVLTAANAVLATHTNIPSFPAAVNGSTQITAISDDTIDANGTAAKIRVTKGGMVNEFVAPGEVTFADNNYIAGGTSKITSITLNYPTGGL